MEIFSKKLFKYRSYTPIPFLLIAIVFEQASLTSLIVGFIIALVGEVLRLWGVSIAGRETRTTKKVRSSFLVVTRAFGYVRNPLYLGNIVIYTGIGIMSMAFFPYLQIGGLIFFYLQYNIIISVEEKHLEQSFGEHYKDYKESVPKLIPKLTPYENPDLAQPKFKLEKGIKSEIRTFQAFGLATLAIIISFVLDKS